MRTNLTQKIDFEILDGLRGIAALYVVINHCRSNMMITGSQLATEIPYSDWSIITKIYYAILQSTILGKEFVVLFFILSGFSIAHSLNKNISWWGFFKRRLIRLYPPLILALLWAFLVYNLCTSTGPFYNLSSSVFFDAYSILLNLIYIPSGDLIPQFWSLTHEVIFYLISPFVLVSEKVKLLFISCSIILFVIFTFLSPLMPVTDFILINFICDYAVFFSCGIILYYYRNLFLKFRILIYPLFAVMSISILFIAMVIFKYYLGLHNKFSLIIAVVFSSVLIINFLYHRIKFQFLIKLGKMSYTLYITHFASIYFILFLLLKLGVVGRYALPNIWYLWIIGVFGCVVLAIPFYYIAERPSQKILQRFRNIT